MEVVSKSMRSPYLVISSEDMLARVMGYNREIVKKREEWTVDKIILEKECVTYIQILTKKLKNMKKIKTGKEQKR